MLARGDWRVRSVDYENAPFGREVHSASPYRWWLVLLAWLAHIASGRPLGLCVERAAFYADPLLHIGLLVAATIFVARRFGPFCAALFSVGLAAVFPLASAFLPGVANDFGMEQVCTLWSVLLLVAGTLAGQRAQRWYLAGGVAGGCGLWLSAFGQAPIIAGIAAGGLLAALIGRGSRKERDASAGVAALAPWRAWALGGAASSLLAYLVEYFPGHMGPQVRVNYPLYGLAWLGLGELLWRFESWLRGERAFGGLRGLGMWIISAAAVASLPVAVLRIGGRSSLAGDLLSARLTNLPNGVVADNLSAWMARGGPGGALAATCLPLLLLAPAAWSLLGRRLGADAPQGDRDCPGAGPGRPGAFNRPASLVEHIRYGSPSAAGRGDRGRPFNGQSPDVELAVVRPPRSGCRVRHSADCARGGRWRVRQVPAHASRGRGPLRARPLPVDRGSRGTRGRDRPGAASAHVEPMLLRRAARARNAELGQRGRPVGRNPHSHRDEPE